jgi:2-methylcitrate dehydratase PrpD
MDTPPTRRLADFVHSLQDDDLPVAVRGHVEALLVDAVGCALAGWLAEEMSQVEAASTSLGSTGSTTVIGGVRTSAINAVFQNAYLITGMTACDVYTPAHFHVTPEVVPVALAIAEQRHLTGTDLVTGVAAGAEVAARLAESLDYGTFRGNGWHAPGIIGPMGAAAAGAKLLGLDVSGIRRAISLAYSQAAGTFASWPTSAVKFHQSRGAVGGLLAALLAEQGLEASEEPILAEDGGLFTSYAPGDPEALVSGLKERWEVRNISLRLWPGATPVQALLTALLANPSTAGISADQVLRVTIEVNPRTHASHRDLVRPRGAFEALLSFHFVAAAALHEGCFGVDSVRPEVYTNPQIVQFIEDRIAFVPEPGLSIGTVRVTLSLTDGRTLIVREDHARGTPQAPATTAELEAKFRAFATSRLPSTDAGRLLDLLRDIPALDDCAELMEATQMRSR